MDKIQQHNLISLLVLQRLPDTAAVTLQKLFARFHTLSGIMQASSAELETFLSRPAREDFEEYRSRRERSSAGQRACRDLDYLQQHNISLLSIESEEYPQQLLEVYHAPPLLMVQGDVSLLSKEQIAVVGSRRASPSGLEHAAHFASELAASGFTVTSGMALGIDGAAHKGALSVDKDLNERPTIAVIATGLDLCYPSRHQLLKSEILERGAIISEFPLGTPPQKENFPRRNRIISGLSKGVLVVEAEEKSGSLITAKYALEQNREVFAVPGSINNPASRGCHQLIREGAKLVESVDDILAELQHPFGQVILRFSHQEKINSGTEREIPTEKEKYLLGHMDENSVHRDHLARRASLPVDETIAILVNLEINGWVETVDSLYRKI
jgi:DNA processing protein